MTNLRYNELSVIVDSSLYQAFAVNTIVKKRALFIKKF